MHDESTRPLRPELPRERVLSAFDRIIGGLVDRPDVTTVKPSTVANYEPILGAAQSFIVRTFRVKDQGDRIFIECISDADNYRIALPPKVAEAIARQRDSLAKRVRSKVSAQAMEQRIANGFKPDFGGKRGKRTGRKGLRRALRKYYDQGVLDHGDGITLEEGIAGGGGPRMSTRAAYERGWRDAKHAAGNPGKPKVAS